MMGDIAVRISDVHLAFGKNRVLRGVNGQIKKGVLLLFGEKWMRKVNALKNSDR